MILNQVLKTLKKKYYFDDVHLKNLQYIKIISQPVLLTTCTLNVNS